MTDDSGEDEGPLPRGTLLAERYRIGGVLGEGGMGVVYDAVHEGLGRPVAVKVIPPWLAADRESVQRFLQEARAAASLGHPGIVQVFDVGTTATARGELTWLAMERLEGEELGALLAREGPLPVARAVGVVAEAAEALSVAHARGIVHRDLKPQNLFLSTVGPREVVKVLDFGIAKLDDGGGAGGPRTRTGQVFGTPAYMSPEQLRGERALDGRSDVYALGVVLYELLAGAPPFDATSFATLAVAVATMPPPPLAARRPDVPAPLAALVHAALAKEPAERPADALAFAQALRAIGAAAPTLRASAVPTARHLPGLAAGAAAADGAAADGARAGGLPAGGAAAGRTAVPSGATRRAALVAAVALALAVLSASILAGRGRPEVGRAAAPAGATVRFESTPPGATVRVEGAALGCVTPCELVLPPRPLDAVGRLEGHHARTELLEPPFPPVVRFDLPPRRGAPAPGRATQRAAP